MTSETVRVGVIGTGFATKVQVPAFQRCAGVEVVALASGREERARQEAERFDLAVAYGDYRKMLAEQDLDLVSIVTPPYLHHEMTMAALEAGHNVLCEKPFAKNLDQGREMLAAAEQAGVIHAVDHEFRYLPARLRMKELVDDGYLGEVRTVRISSLSDMLLDVDGRPWSWWSDLDCAGGILGAQGSHLIDSLIWYFGDIAAVAAQLDTFIRRRPMPDGSEWRDVTSDDQVAALFRLANGAQVNFLVSGVTRPQGVRFEAYGSDGALIIDEPSLFGARRGGELEPIELPPPPPLQAGDDGRISPFLAFLDRFLPRLRGEAGPDVPNFRDGLRVQAVMDAIHLSAEEKSIVSVGGL